MANPSKRSFSSFIKRNPEQIAEMSGRFESSALDTFRADPAAGNLDRVTGNERLEATAPGSVQEVEVRQASSPAGEGGPRESAGRQRVVTSTGRVRTYTASRNLPGVTLRLTEDRWERLKLLSVQERRPIQEILGEAMEAYMKGRGLRW